MRTHVSRIPASPVTSGRSGLLTRSTSRSVIWLRAFEAAFRNDAQREPRAMAPTTAQVTRRAGSGLWMLPKAQTAPETIPRSGGRSVKGRVRRRAVRGVMSANAEATPKS